MSDMQAPDQTQSITDLIVNAPEPTWRKLKAQLKVATRDEAVALVAQDEKAASMALSILTSIKGDKSLLTQAATMPEETMLTASAKRGKSAGMKF
jgi:uncharacterized protein (DUF2141 family)